MRTNFRTEYLIDDDGKFQCLEVAKAYAFTRKMTHPGEPFLSKTVVWRSALCDDLRPSASFVVQHKVSG